MALTSRQAPVPRSPTAPNAPRLRDTGATKPAAKRIPGIMCNAIPRDGKKGVGKMRKELREYRQRVAQLIVESITELDPACSCREEKREPGTCKPCREIHRLYKALDVLED